MFDTVQVTLEADLLVSIRCLLECILVILNAGVAFGVGWVIWYFISP